MESEKQPVEAFYADYLRAFHTLDAQSVVPFYAPPCLFVGDSGTILMRDEAEIEAFFTNVINELKPKNYHHSEIHDLQVETLSPQLALVRGLAIRYTTDGGELERLRAVYTLRKVSGAWKFVTALAHPASG